MKDPSTPSTTENASEIKAKPRSRVRWLLAAIAVAASLVRLREFRKRPRAPSTWETIRDHIRMED